MKPFLSVLLMIIVLPAVLVSEASACLNDRDTLAEEIKGLPDVTRVITGRFERNPPLYYEMRLQRVSDELRIHDDILGDYDDAAVACDRLGRDDEGIAFMTRKHHMLAQMRTDTPGIQEDWYKYYANIGTCRVHRWIRNGANRNDLKEVAQAKKEIDQALKIKPDAHFGREKYQEMVMQCIISPPVNLGNTQNGLAQNLTSLGDNPQTIRKGLCGLFVLGNAWESPDVFRAMVDLLGYRNDHLTNWCMLRVRELEANGRQNMLPLSDAGMRQEKERLAGIDSYDTAEYKHFRDEADAWQAKRTAFMMARLIAGRHPDTDPHFWDGYSDAGPPDLSIPFFRSVELWGRPYFGAHWFPRLPIAVILFSLPIIWLFRREIRNIRERRRIHG